MAKKNEKLKLTRAEKKQLQELMTRSQQQNAKKVPRTAQATIPYQRMWPDGICRVTDNYYTKTIQFQDINYQLAQNLPQPDRQCGILRAEHHHPG